MAAKKPSPELVKLLGLIGGKCAGMTAVEIAYFMWPDRKGRTPSGGGPCSLAVSMSYWLGKLVKKNIIVIHRRDGDHRRRYRLATAGREMISLQNLLRSPRSDD